MVKTDIGYGLMAAALLAGAMASPWGFDVPEAIVIGGTKKPVQRVAIKDRSKAKAARKARKANRK